MMSTRLLIRQMHAIRNASTQATPRNIPIMHSKIKSQVVEPPHMDLRIHLDMTAKVASEPLSLEQTMRGHSAMMEGSLVQRSIPLHVRRKAAGLDDDDDDDDKKKKNKQLLVSSDHEKMERMKALLELLQMEIQAAADLRQNVSALKNEESDVNTSDNAAVVKSTTTKQELLSESEEEMKKRQLVELGVLYSYPGAAGPSVQMYDLVLDALSLQAKTKNSIQISKALLDGLLERYEALSAAKDCYQGKANEVQKEENVLSDDDINFIAALNQIDMNLYAPTAVSFNAVIRTAANADVDPNNEEERDLALTSSFLSLYRIHNSEYVHRNSATFTYILKVVEKYIPKSRSRGNIARGLFQKACDDGVVSDTVLNALAKISGGGGVDFDAWIPQIIEGKELPQKWRRNVKLRMHRHGGGVY